jgi:uncharacterized protein (TIGR02145 family)
MSQISIFSLTTIDDYSMMVDTGAGAYPASATFYARGNSGPDFENKVLVNHKTMSDWVEAKEVDVANITVNGATFTSVSSAVKAINDLCVNFTKPSGGGSGGGIPEAPTGGPYARTADNGGTWVSVSGGSNVGSLTEHTDIKSSDNVTITTVDPDNSGETITRTVATTDMISPPRAIDVTEHFTFNPEVADAIVEKIETEGKRPRIRIKAQAGPDAGNSDLTITASPGFGAYYDHVNTRAFIRPGKDVATGSTGLYDVTATGESQDVQTVITVPKEISDVEIEYFLGTGETMPEFGWRVPTTEEFKALDSAYRGSWATINGINGRRFGDAISGPFFPAAGLREETGEITRQGSDGFYWSATLVNTTNAYYMLSGRYSMFPSANDGYRRNGYAVRLVRDITTTNFIPCPAGEFRLGDIVWAKSNYLGNSVFCETEVDYGNYFTFDEANA